MKTKNVLVSFLAVFAVLALVATVSAADFSSVDVKVDGTYVMSNGNTTGTSIGLEAGDTVSVLVRFTSEVYDKDVTITAEFKGYGETEVESRTFDVEEGQTYSQTLSIKVPYDLKDDLSDELKLNLNIEGDDYDLDLDTIYLRVQRPSYNADIKSVSVSQSVEAGETFPVEIVLKNMGYNDLDDVYVKASIDALGIEKTGYFGDVVALECDEDDNAVENYGVNVSRKCNEDDSDTVSGVLYLAVPYGVKAGIYNLQIEVISDDSTSSKVVQVVVDNAFETTVFKSGNSVWIVNPTDNVVGYRVVAESPASVDESIVFVGAGESKTITVEPNADGEYAFDVNVFDMKGSLVATIPFSGTAGSAADDNSQTNPIVILTVILAVIFIVLLIVLIVLIGKKPEKQGEFGESYY